MLIGDLYFPTTFSVKPMFMEAVLIVSIPSRKLTGHTSIGPPAGTTFNMRMSVAFDILYQSLCILSAQKDIGL